MSSFCMCLTLLPVIVSPDEEDAARNLWQGIQLGIAG